MARVLIVEDEPVTAADLEQKLAHLGHEVAASLDNGEDVVAQAAGLAPDLVLMDIRLRGAMNGIEAARQLRARGDVPIVFLTAFADQETVDRACETEPHGYLLKPFTERSVATAVQVALTRARAERTHAERERFMSAALRSAGEALVAVDDRGAVRFMNEHAELLLNVNEPDALGKDARVIVRFAERSSGDSTHPLDSALRDGRMTGAPERDLLVTGRTGPLRVAYCAAPVLSAEGAKAGAVLVFHESPPPGAAPGPEVTGTLNALSMRLSHEINNPLTYNLSALQLAMRELDQLRAMSSLEATNDPSATEREKQLVRIGSLLRGAEEGATRIAGVIRELKSLSSPERDLAPLYPVELLDLAIGLSGVGASAHVRVTRQVSPAPMIRGSKWQLSRVLAYAVEHAVESLDARSPGGNTLLVEVRTDARGWAEFRVLARRQQGSVRLPSRESSHGSLDVARTTSVSMTMVQHLVESHGGELLVREQPDGLLLEFRFPPMSVAAVRLAGAAAAARRGSVLVIDDEPMVGRVLEMTLRSEHDVKVVTSAASALALLERSDAFDVILCDLSMPGMDGQELYEQLCITRPDLASRMIFMSGGATAERGARFLDDMAGRRIDKPFQTAHLLELLREQLRAGGKPPPPAQC